MQACSLLSRWLWLNICLLHRTYCQWENMIPNTSKRVTTTPLHVLLSSSNSGKFYLNIKVLNSVFKHCFLKNLCRAPTEVQHHQWFSTAFGDLGKGGNYVFKWHRLHTPLNSHIPLWGSLLIILSTLCIKL